MTGERARLFLILICMGAGWGATQPAAKVAVSEGYRNFGIIFWQMLIGAVLLGAFLATRGRLGLIDRRQMWFAAWIALVGTILPNGAGYQAAVHLPAGVLSIVIAAVPMLVFPLALAMGLDRFGWPRLAGLVLGLGGVALLTAPESLPGAAAGLWVLVALIAPALYAVEGTTVAKWGTFGMDPVQVLFWASAIGTVLSLPIALASGTWIDPRPPWGLPDLAILAGSALHAVVYATYVWMVGRAGPVFAGQVSYLVTGFGVLWAMLLLGETYSPHVWAALALVAVGMFLVLPRDRAALAAEG